MKDILMPDEIRKAIEHPVLGNNHFGSWGILNRQQILSINNLLDILDSADSLIKAQARKIKKQQKEIEYYKDELEKESSIWTKIEKGNDYISKDKIIEKIKELKNDLKIKEEQNEYFETLAKIEILEEISRW